MRTTIGRNVPIFGTCLKISSQGAIPPTMSAATAVAEKLAAVNTAAYFAERREREDFVAFDKIMKRKGGEAPQTEDLNP
jgi:hypothetical protein